MGRSVISFTRAWAQGGARSPRHYQPQPREKPACTYLTARKTLLALRSDTALRRDATITWFCIVMTCSDRALVGGGIPCAGTEALENTQRRRTAVHPLRSEAFIPRLDLQDLKVTILPGAGVAVGMWE